MMLTAQARNRDPITSDLAAEKATRQEFVAVKDQVQLILMRAEALTDDQIFDFYRRTGGRRTPQRLRTARAELVRDGIVVESAMPGVSENGNPAQKWELA